MSSFLGFCDDAGHFKLDNRHAFDAFVSEKFKGQEVVLTVQSRTVYRSIRANNYYWSQVVTPAAKESGQSADAIHDYWCELFLPEEKKRLMFFNRLTGVKLQVTIDSRRSSKLTGTLFYDFVENCRLWCQEFLGLDTQPPDPDYWKKRAAQPRVTSTVPDRQLHEVSA